MFKIHQNTSSSYSNSVHRQACVHVLDVYRLSEVASLRMSIGNPNCADLSDSNRPTKIGEKFSELYNNEWTQLFESLESEIEDETQRISKLCECVQVCISG